MEDELALIESFFNDELSAQARQEFEKRCSTDPAFAETVAAYVKAKYASKKLHWQERKADFEELRKKPKPSMVVKPVFRYWIAAVAAVCIAILSWLYLREPDLTKLANAYVDENFQVLGTTMSADKNTFKQAIALFNKGELAEAAKMFDSLAEYNNPEALKYAGISYLRLGNYTLALEHFETLQKQNLQSNPGTFYKALTLLQRNQNNDLTEAKKLLEKVKNEKSEGWQEIEKWGL
ncbi:tetratricopeptide repeat protein [Emticicia fontis]